MQLTTTTTVDFHCSLLWNSSRKLQTCKKSYLALAFCSGNPPQHSSMSHTPTTTLIRSDPPKKSTEYELIHRSKNVEDRCIKLRPYSFLGPFPWQIFKNPSGASILDAGCFHLRCQLHPNPPSPASPPLRSLPLLCCLCFFNLIFLILLSHCSSCVSIFSFLRALLDFTPSSN